MKILPVLLVSLAVAGPGRADDDVVGGFRQQAQGQRAVAAAGASSMKSAGAASDLEAAIRSEFPPAETPESMKSYGDELAAKLVKITKQKKGELPPDPPVAVVPYVPVPDPTPEQIDAAAAKLPPEIGEASGRDAAHRIVRLRKQWSGAPRNQGQVGSCATFAGVAELEAAYMREYGSPIEFSKMWVLRALIGQDLSDAGMGIIRSRAVDKSYLGAYPAEDVMPIVRKYGICREEAFPYDPYVAQQFDAYTGGSSWFKKSDDVVHRKALESFAKHFKLAGDPKLAKAAAENEQFKGRFAGFRTGEVRNATTANIRRFLGFGIPLFVGMAFEEHAVVLNGYDERMKSYIIRNSWGTSDASKGFGTVFTSVEYIVGPKDIARACADRDAAPPDLLDYCR